MARTHDISYVDYHVKDLATFGERLTEAANAAFPRGQSRYKNVHAVLVSWEEDNLGVISEVVELRDVFRHTYFYDADEWRIPSTHSYKALRRRMSKFLDEFEDKENLLIIYYGGHGFMNDDRQCIWSCTGAPESATVQWSGLQNLFEHAESDVLVLLDCCAAASSISGTGSGVTEIIAACGFETWAPGVGEHSFTRSLIDELKYWSRNHTLSVALLHNKVLSRIKYWKPRFGITGEHEQRKTPIYIVVANERKQRSIELRPLRPQVLPPVELPATFVHESQSDSSSSSLGVPMSTDEDISNSSHSSLEQVWPDPGFRNPKVLISLALEEDQWLRTDDWVEWMQSVPALVKHAHVDGIYKSGSTLMLLSIPVAIWNLLPADQAITFIGFIWSDNLLGRRKPSVCGNQEQVNVKKRISMDTSKGLQIKHELPRYEDTKKVSLIGQAYSENIGPSLFGQTMDFIPRLKRGEEGGQVMATDATTAKQGEDPLNSLRTVACLDESGAILSDSTPRDRDTEGIENLLSRSSYRREQSANLNKEIAESSGRILHFSRDYSNRMHQRQRSGPLPGSLPSLAECEEMIREQGKVLAALAQMRDVSCQ